MTLVRIKKTLNSFHNGNRHNRGFSNNYFNLSKANVRNLVYVHMRGRALLFAGTQVFTLLLKNHVHDLKFQFRAPKWTKMRFGNFPLLGYQTRAF